MKFHQEFQRTDDPGSPTMPSYRTRQQEMYMSKKIAACAIMRQDLAKTRPNANISQGLPFAGQAHRPVQNSPWCGESPNTPVSSTNIAKDCKETPHGHARCRLHTSSDRENQLCSQRPATQAASTITCDSSRSHKSACCRRGGLRRLE